MGRRERKKHGEAIWVLLLLLVLIVIKASFLPKVAPCKSPPLGIYTSLHFHVVHVHVFLSSIVLKASNQITMVVVFFLVLDMFFSSGFRSMRVRSS
jgi:hypothetical protein